MATSTLQVIVETNTRQLDKLQGQFKKTETQLQKLQGKLKNGLTSSFRTAGNAGRAAGVKIQSAFKRAADGAAKLQKNLGGVRSTLVGLGSAAGLGFAAKSAASFEQTQLRLQLLSKEYGEFDRIQKLVASNATTFNQSQKESAENFANVYARLRPLGKTLEEIQTTYEGFNAVAIASGASAQEASSAFLQLSQALGSGRLQGDEFRSIAEQVPGILKLVADEMGVTVGELKKLGSEGMITSDVLINSLAKGFDENKDAIAELIALSPVQKFKAFENATTELSVAVGQELLPALLPLVELATDLLKEFGKLPGPVKTLAVAFTALATAALIAAPALGAVAGGLAALAPAAVAAGGGAKVLAGGLVVLKGAMLALPWVALAAGITAATVGIVKYYQDQKALNALLRDGAGSTQQLADKQSELEQRLAAVRGKLDGTTTGFAATGREAQRLKKEAALLEGQLTQLAKTYEIRLKLVKQGFSFDEQGNASTYRVSGIDYDAKTGRAINPPPTVSEQLASQVSNLSAPLGGGGSSGGGGAAVRESEVPELTRALELSDKLLQIDRARLEAQFQGNSARIKELSELRVITELEGKKAEITAEDIPDEEKKLKIQKEENVAALRGLQIKYQALEIEKQRQLAIEGALLPLQQETELLQAKLQGLGGEVALRQQAANIAAATPGLDQAQVEAILRKNQALREQVEAQEKLEAQSKELAGAISSELGSAFKSIIQGTKTTEEAFADMFQGIADSFLDMAMKILQDAITQQLVSLFSNLLGDTSGGGGGFLGSSGNGFGQLFGDYSSFGGMFADGGTLGAGKWGIAGEAGPELISGPATITPSSQMGGTDNTVVNITINSNGGGSSSASGNNAQEAAQLGRLIERSTLAVINREKRPGGTLSR